MHDLSYRGDTLDHVVDVGDDGANAGDVLAGTEPDGDLEGLLARTLDLDGSVGKVTLEGSTGTGNLDNAGLDLDGD